MVQRGMSISVDDEEWRLAHVLLYTVKDVFPDKRGRYDAWNEAISIVKKMHQAIDDSLKIATRKEFAMTPKEQAAAVRLLTQWVGGYTQGLSQAAADLLYVSTLQFLQLNIATLEVVEKDLP